MLAHYLFAYDTVICDSHITIKLDGNSNDSNLVFIESPNFPKSMNHIDKEKCKLNFTVDNPMEEYVVRLIITNGYLENVAITDEKKQLFNLITTQQKMFSLQLKTTSLTIDFYDASLTLWNAFQGYVIYEHTEICPFTIKPFTFENESQIIYLKYPFVSDEIQNPNFFQIATCNWIFKGPKGYEFKLVHRSKKTITMSLSAFNSNGYDIVKGYGLLENQKYYNGDNYLKIVASFEKFYDNDSFEAYVTIVKNKWDTEDAECNLISDGSRVIWYNSENDGYPNNAECSIAIPIPPNSFIDTSLIYLNIEPYVDYINFVDAQGIIHHMNHLFETRWGFFETNLLSSDSNESFVEANFVTDGSIQNEGFLIVFETLECTCASDIIVVPCTGEYEYSILNQTSLYICPHTLCNFKLKTNGCSSKNFILKLQPLLLGYMLGLTINIDDKVYFDSRELGTIYQQIISIPLLSNENIELNFFSFRQKAQEISSPMTFALTTIDAPLILKPITLSNESPIYKVDFVMLPKNSVLTVHLSDELRSNNDLIEMYFSKLFEISCILLYKNDKLEKITNDVLWLFIPPYKISNNGSITIYKSIHCEMTTFLMPVLFRAKKAHSKNCVFSNNIINGELPFAISAMAMESGECEVILLTPFPRFIKTIWTNSITQEMKISSGSNTKSLELSYNKTDINLWENVILGSNFYTFTIPPKSSLYIVASYPERVIKIDTAPFKSVLDTLFFGTFIQHVAPSDIIGIYDIGDAPTVFYVEIIDLSSNAQLYTTDNANNTIKFDHVGQSQIFQNSVIIVHFNEIEAGHAGARLLISTSNEI